MEGGWMEDLKQQSVQIEEDRFLDEAWLLRMQSERTSGDLHSMGESRLPALGDGLHGLLAAYPMLCAIPAFVIGAVAFLMVIRFLIG